MEINRRMAIENTRPLLLFLVMMTVLSLAPMLSHAAVFWDDEMEEGPSEFSTSYMASYLIPSGIMAYDTSVKFSGNGSIRLNYPPACQTLTTQNQCGGSATRTFPLTDNVWKRVYFRMSGTGPNRTNSGLVLSHSCENRPGDRGFQSTETPAPLTRHTDSVSSTFDRRKENSTGSSHCR